MFAAHISYDKNNEQSVQDHCINTAELCAGYCSLFEAEKIGWLAGLLHDAGKLCNDFDDYIRGNSHFSRGEIDHCYKHQKKTREVSLPTEGVD
ncbi:HD domain-containing protein [Ruminococcus flavefaciens]|uniref:HD domain-containing protein n=1 Tax=Ruminococcus flavefaciens TaxID=1265 RepID=UPI00030124AF|nr:HD domain-containing protein [Ruminococcus flavefaciens]